MQQLVSILIPTFNREKVIRKTILSACNQTYKNIEIIIVDNCSIDNTWRIIKNLANKDARIKCYRNKENIGPVRNWLKCVELSNGQYGKILWSDDLISQDFIEKTLKNLMPDIGFVYTKVNIINDDDCVSGRMFDIGPSHKMLSSEFIKRSLLTNTVPVSPGCALFRMKDLKKNLLLNIKNRKNIDFSMHAIGNDLLLYLLTAKDYKYCYYLSIASSSFRASSDSITVVSNNLKLRTYYLMASAYFVECCYNRYYYITYLLIRLNEMKAKDKKNIGIENWRDYFNNNRKVKFSGSFLAFFNIIYFKIAFKVKDHLKKGMLIWK
jgi:glycosyltransferase involved in cell wall biosynthesis